eukprot:5083807-Pyramimonas_sp.AAC.1
MIAIEVSPVYRSLFHFLLRAVRGGMQWARFSGGGERGIGGRRGGGKQKQEQEKEGGAGGGKGAGNRRRWGDVTESARQYFAG